MPCLQASCNCAAAASTALLPCRCCLCAVETDVAAALAAPPGASQAGALALASARNTSMSAPNSQRESSTGWCSAELSEVAGVLMGAGLLGLRVNCNTLMAGLTGEGKLLGWAALLWLPCGMPCC